MGVSGGTVFFDIQANFFQFFRYPDAHRRFEDHHDDKGEDKGERADRHSADNLLHQAVVGIRREDSHSNRAPNAANTMNRNRPNRIIDLQLIKEDDGEGAMSEVVTGVRGLAESGEILLLEQDETKEEAA